MDPARLRQQLIQDVDNIIQSLTALHVTSGDLRIEANIIDGSKGRYPRSKARQILLDTINLADPSSRSRDVDDVTHTPGRQSQQRAEVQHLPSPARSDSNGLEREAPSGSDSGDETRKNDSALETSGLAEMKKSDHVSARRRKTVGGLSISKATTTCPMPSRSPSPPTTRQLQTDQAHFRKRRRVEEPPRLVQSNVDKLIESIWKEIHNPNSLVLDQEYTSLLDDLMHKDNMSGTDRLGPASFEMATRSCRRLTEGARAGRALEVIMQAHWVDCFDLQIGELAETRPDQRPLEHKKATLLQACESFSWSEKDLRNRMAIWKGYRDIKAAAGWSALIFAGSGIYRFCKYRLGLDPEALSKLRALRTRFEVAADTIHPHWRRLLPIVGDSAQLHWRGHPHDWVVSKRKDAVPLAFTYRQWDSNFSFRHMCESIVDTEKWGDSVDPRRVSDGPDFVCNLCAHRQSANPQENECACFSELFDVHSASKPCPVQVYQTENGRNNGLIACNSFARGVAVGEFVGLVTKGLSHIDVMQSRAGDGGEPYQIWQGRCGNFTRFINHSCEPNCLFQTFVWLGVQRILVISKGVAASKELTVDYSSRYWEQLDKKCLCGSVKCRFGNRSPAGRTWKND